MIRILFAFVVIFTAMPALAAPLSFTVTMSEAVNVGTGGGTPRIAVNVGGVTRYASYAGGTGSSALTFTYTPQAGDLDLDGVAVSSPVDLNGGAITDLNGNAISNLTFTPPNTTNVKVDYPSLSMDFINSDYILSGTHYGTLSSFLTAAGGTYTRGSVGTYFDSSGTLQTAGNNVARFDYDPVTHAAKGILIEEQRTNLLLRTTEFENAVWLTNGRATITANAVTSPDGTSSAELLTEDATATQTHGIYTNTATSITAGEYYTYSVFAKNMSGARQLHLQLVNTGGAWAFSPGGFFNLSTGTLGNVTAGSTASITPVGNGWYRCTLTSPAAIATAASTGAKQIYLASGNNQIYSGDGSSGFYIWGAQLEKGSFSTSYIPTTNASVTRAEDFLTIPVGAWYNSTVGSFYNDISWVTSSGTYYPMFFRVDDGTSSNRWNLFYSQLSNVIGIDTWSAGAYQGGFSVLSPTSGSIRAAGAQALNSANASFNGVLQTLDTSWSTPLAVTQFQLRGPSANKWHKKLKYYPDRVSDTQLQLLTQ